MAKEKSEGGGSFLGNPNALLAVLTIAGGLWLVSQKLTSDRPVTPAGGAKEFVGDQKLEARLWEDPFKNLTDSDRDETTSVAVDMETLAGQIARPRQSGPEPAKGVLLMPVIVSGGQYSEDQETRIRCRFAVVSALGQSGYVPDDAEHIGVLKIPWLTRQDVDRAKQDKEGAVTQLWAQSSKVRLLGLEPSAHMDVRYEWYRRRDFSAGSDVKKAWSWVLVLWLDESCFENEPLLRLALLLERWSDPSRYKPNLTRQPDLALIGPRRSSTLRAMLNDWRPEVPLLSHIANPSFGPLVSKVLQRIDVFCATPSAMDEVLVKAPIEPNDTPRASVRAKLTLEGKGFRSFHNLSVTDAQMAHEVFEELKLRGADPAPDDGNKIGYKNHVVLISEWDTFQGRMLSLTYGAELAVRQRPGLSRAKFVGGYASDQEAFPENFHSFVYLRGLDGQTVGASGTKDDERDKGRDAKSAPSSIEELRHWTPDVNKAEGQAQFDYLGRLGDQIVELQQTLARENRGRVRAIGIVGSDVYDTLLVLQALRNRFPELLFFTTDLDVRFFHPLEREWARNLIVVSGYGLALNLDLQGTVPPFRDSKQTAQFAATLAALGNRSLAEVARIPPRRFEVGNRTAVDLSQPQQIDPATPWIHPLTASESYRIQPPDYSAHLRNGIVAAILILAIAIWRWRPLRRLTVDAFGYPGEALVYTEEDIGGPDGAEALLRELVKHPEHRIAKWIVEWPRVAEIKANLEKEPKEPPASAVLALVKSLNEQTTKELEGKAGITDDLSRERLKGLNELTGEVLERKTEEAHLEIDWNREKAQTELSSVLVDALNQLLPSAKSRQRIAGPKKEILSSALRNSGWFVMILRMLPPSRRMIERYEERRFLDIFLAQMSGAQPVYKIKQRDVAAGWWTDIVAFVPEHVPIVNRCLDVTLGDLNAPRSTVDEGQMDYDEAALHAAVFARESAEDIFFLRCRRLALFWLGAVGLGLTTLWITWIIWGDTCVRSDGEPFSLTSGTSAWPAEIVRLLVLVLAISFSVSLSLKLRGAFLSLTRRFRLSPPPDSKREENDTVCAQNIWYDYRKKSRFRRRWLWVIGFMYLYYRLVLAIFQASGESSLTPMRGISNLALNGVIGLSAFFGFLMLAFLTVEAAHRCREFIESLSAHPTQYPKATRRHFSRQMGRIDDEYLDEWIDLQLIAELTEQVGGLVYYPASLVLLMLLARNSWWDCWSWPVSFMVIFALNFLLALASVVILQRAAKEAKRKAEQSLTAKVKKLQAQVAPSAAQNNAAQAQELLKEISQLHRGAFVPFWENPVVGAVFLSSGGTTILQVAIWFMGR